MLVKFSIIISFIVFSCSVFCQTGTIIIGYISQNEILLAADSRGVYYETDDHTQLPIAYYDSICKIFKIKQFAIAVAGASAIGKTFFHEIISDYNKTPYTDTSLYLTLKDFLFYLNTRFPKESFPEMVSNTFIIGGYVNEKPQLIGILTSQNKIIRQSSGIIVNDSSAIKYAFQNSNKEGTLNQLIENTIYDCAKGENKTNEIGGPISIIRIARGNKISWIQNNFSNKNYKSMEDFYNAVKFDIIKMNYLVPNAKERLLKIMRH